MSFPPDYFSNPRVRQNFDQANRDARDLLASMGPIPKPPVIAAGRKRPASPAKARPTAATRTPPRSQASPSTLQQIAQDQRAAQAADAEARQRDEAVAGVLARFGLTGTALGRDLLAGEHTPDAVRAMLASRASRNGRLTQQAQNALRNDLKETP